MLTLVLVYLGWRYLPRGGTPALVVLLGITVIFAYAANFAADGNSTLSDLSD